MTEENRTISIVEFDRTITGGQFDTVDLLLVARNTKSRLLRIQLTMNTTQTMTGASSHMILIVPWRLPNTGLTLPNGQTFSAMFPLASASGGWAIIGTPANQAILLPEAEIEIDFSKIVRRGVAVESKGARSNERAGWSLLMLNTGVVDWDTDFCITAEAIDEWLGGSGSRANMNIENTEFDEGENYD